MITVWRGKEKDCLISFSFEIRKKPIKEIHYIKLCGLLFDKKKKSQER